MHSWTRTLFRLCLGLTALGAAGVAYAELGDPAGNTAACCQLTTSMVNDVIRGKDSSGDEKFFSSDGAPPNIHFLVDLSSSMRELPQLIDSGHKDFFDITVNGCNNPRLDAFEVSRGWNPATQYPIPDPGTGLGSDNGFPDLFKDDKFYGYMFWNDSSSPAYQWDNKEQACQQQVPNWDTTGASDYATCVNCLATKGYWKLPTATQRDTAPFQNRDFIFWGRFLNFNPPKYVTARAVLKQVIKDLRRVRAGISVFTTNSTLTSLVQGQNPSCKQIANDASSFDSNRASFINGVNGWTFTTGTPLGKSLLNVGYYFTSDDSVYKTTFGFGSNYSYPNEFANGPLTQEGRSVCWGCQTSSVIIITDGEPSGDNFTSTMAAKLRAVNGGPVYCPDSRPCNSGTTNNTRDKGRLDTDPSDDNPLFYLDDVAKMLYTQDLQANTPPVVGDFNTAGKQSVITYAVGFGTSSNLLKSAADVGGGLFYTADDAASLKQALLDIINNVQTRATSFSSAAAATLQVHGASAAIIPRFKPARSKAMPWQGLLYRFNLWNENVEPCTPKGVGDKNNDGDCLDTLLIDKAGDAVIENDDGGFVKLLQPLVPAVPFWEAGNVLKPSSSPSQVWKTRKIYTIVDSNNDGLLDFRDTPIPFDEAHSSQLREYLGISQNPSTCADIAAMQGVASLTPDECAKVVIRWYRGADELNPDPSKRGPSGYDRDFLLGDIFHSSPISVSPPMGRNFCAFSTQCIQSLFSGATSQQNDYTIATTTGVSAYEKYVDAAGQRDELTLVGSNDGMLHAFLTGVSTGTKDSFTGQIKHDEGTGQEVWAFIPPDMLPKLRNNIGKHAYSVDSSAMVRDVWIDGAEGQAPDGKKQWQEYRTVAVVGTGRGGVHRFALDLTRLLGRSANASQSVVPDQAGDFLWMWPQPCDPLALQVGESFSNFAPRPAPIGPVALTPQADDALRSMYGPVGGSPESPYLINNTAARERYVVFLNGGYDQSMTRGRGMAIVDIRSGHTIWSFFNGDGKSLSSHLLYPIGAGISPTDIGRADSPANDGDFLFDTAAVGDYGGQLWTLRFWQPGTWDSAKKQVNNWYAARSFRTANLAGKTTDPEAIRPAFSYMVLGARQPETGFWRVYVGTGDRENKMDQGSICRLSNPRACAAQGCGVNNTLTIKRGGSTVMTSNATLTSYHYGSGGVSAPSATTNSCASAQVNLTWDNTAANGCGNGLDGSIIYTCDGADPTKWNCRETQNDWAVLNYMSAALSPQRYYGIYAYGGSDPKRKFNTDAEAQTYDNNLYTDTDLVNVSQFDTNGLVVDASQQSAAPAGKGWFIQYGATNERTGSTGTLLNGCVLWNSFEPSGATGAVCATTGTNVARLYQSNYATGRADCSVGFFNGSTHQWSRYIPSTVISDPGEPTPQVGIGNGQILRGTVTLTPGSGPQGVTTNASDEGVKSLYQIELDRRGHDCRHGASGGTACD
ncbi:MAG: pilus assembly protein PilY [Hyalangium sp.]|uniref:pilus assembly protein PilY n=1 Tax=Hyalangium sp. TaxID=2028555 RepID=UPI00389A5971